MSRLPRSEEVKSLLPLSKESPGDDERDDEETKLLTILPEEVWSLVLEKVTDPECLENISYASFVLRTLLQPNRVIFLFPKVWKVLATTQYNHIHRKDHQHHEGTLDPRLGLQREALSNIPRMYCDACNGINTGQWYTGILKLRLVCRSWCTAVDDFYQNLPETMKLSEDPNDVIKCTAHLAEDYFDDWRSAKINGFMAYFNFTHPSLADDERVPFLGRALRLAFSDTTEELFNLDLLIMLLEYGRGIWHCTMEVTDRSPGFKCYQNIRALLGLMPNLKTLQIIYHYSKNDQFFFFPQYKSDKPVELRVAQSILYPEKREKIKAKRKENSQLSSYVTSNPLGTLTKLQFLNLTNLPIPIFNELVRSNEHISMLQIRRQMGHGYGLNQQALPNLQQLSCNVHDDRCDFRLLLAPGIDWPVSKLYLDISSSLGSFDLTNMFRLIEMRWADTLTDLTLVLKNSIAYKNSEKEEITSVCQLKITKLTLILKHYISLDLIFPWVKATLQCMHVKDHSNTRKEMRSQYGIIAERNATIKFFSVLDNLHMSNVWELFPELKRVVFQELPQYKKGFERFPSYKFKPWDTFQSWSISRMDCMKMKREVEKSVTE